MELDKALSIISRIDAITDETSEDEIFDIIDDTYYLLALECQNKLETMKAHIDDIVSGYDGDKPTPQVTGKPSKQTAPTDDGDDDVDYEEEIRVPVRKQASATKRAQASSSAKKPAKRVSAQSSVQAPTDEGYETLFD